MRGDQKTIRWMVFRPERASPSKPFAPSQVHRSRAAVARHIRAPRLPHTRAAPIDTTQGSMRRPRRGTADGRHHRADASPRALRPSDDHRTAEQRRVAREPQAPLSAECLAIACRAVVERIWRREGLKVPQKQARKGRLWLGDASCVRLRPERPNHVLSCDFVQDRTQDGRPFRTLDIIDDFTKGAPPLGDAGIACRTTG